MLFIGIIPARYASTRFPGKPLAIIQGKSMIRRVYEQALQASCLAAVYIATDDQQIYEHVREFGGNCVMTSGNHQSGTERCDEAYERIKIDFPDTETVIINIQGDEPFISPEQIKLVADGFSEPGIGITTLKNEITDRADINNPNIVKVVTDRKDNALYFSRSPIPCIRNTSSSDIKYYRHIGIYAYRSVILKQIVNLASTKLETAESLEQLRWLENCIKIKVIETHSKSISVDTPEDLNKFVQ